MSKKVIKKLSKEDTPEAKMKVFLESMSLEELHKVKLQLDDLYYNLGESPVGDRMYDLLKETITKRDKSYSPPVGAKLREGENRTKLPYWMGSADKITPKESEQLKRWLKEHEAKEYVLSEKLDGVSALFERKDGQQKLYTRGDGKVGADISYLIPYTKTIPKDLKDDITVRAELIISKEKFKPYKRQGDERGKLKSGSKDYKNPRNMVAGLVGAKTARHGLGIVDFVAYEVVGNSMPKASKQLKKLKKLGFKVVKHKIVDKVNMKTLSDEFTKMKVESEYDIDGMIVQSNEAYDRNTCGNPDYMFAFKMLTGDAVHETEVKKVEWSVSKWGQLKPVVHVEPVRLDDITIKKATAHNAKYVEENKLGPGSIIKITRSKDVIPYIVDVVKKTKAQMPNINYVWDENHVNISVTKAQSIMCVKLLASMFAKLGIKHVSEATVSKMYEDGLDNLMKILGADKKRLMKIPSFKERSAERIYDNLHAGFQDVKLSLVLGASGIFSFGVGRKRMDMLLLDYPNLLDMPDKYNKKEIKKKILSVEGFSDIMADKIVENLKNSKKFITKLSKYATFKEEKRVSSDMKGHKYVMTGFRDKKLEEDIAERGGKTTSSVSKNTTALIVAVKGAKLSGKSAKAESLGIPIYEKSEFVRKFID